MGRVARWLRSLLGAGKKEQKENGSGSDRKEQKKRWSFGKSSGDDNATGEVGRQIPAVATDGWLRSYTEAYYNETEKEQNKHAIAVAAATAAAADAAVAAAQAAVAVVRLTSHGRGTLFGGRERWAAIKIQTVFRGYLAKKALRALKGLVKLQALVRGYLVRKQAAATLHSMQALIRAQATVRTRKGHSVISKDHRFQPESRPRRSIERFDDSRSENTGSFHSRRLSASLDPINTTFEESPKIVEIDTCRPKSRSRRRINSVSDYGEEISNLPSSSPLPYQIPARLSVPDGWNLQDLDWGLTGEECRFSTAQSTPRFTNSGGSTVGIPVTPAKSVCAESFFRRYSNFPHYMANTQSFRAKVRSQSAPKQRPEPAPKKRLSLNEAVMESRASLSGVRMQRSCSQVQEAFSFKNAIVNKIDRSQELVREAERDYLHRRW